MNVKVTVDGNTYAGVDKIEVGGKSLSLAAEVTTPSGTKNITANGTYDVTDFASAVVAVPTDGDNWLEANAVTVPALKEGANDGNLPEILTLNMPKAKLVAASTVISCGVTVSQNAWFSSGCKHLTLNIADAKEAKLFAVDRSVETVTINTSSGRFGLYRGCFMGCPNLTTINGTITGLDTAGIAGVGTVNDIFYGCTSLANVTFAPNIIGSNMKINTGTVNGVSPTDNFTEATLISLANALKAGEYTLTISAVAKAKLAGIMGNVSQVTDGDVSYDLFTADENGTTSLESFITTTKGWTLG